jgi:hypothetical protein
MVLSSFGKHFRFRHSGDLGDIIFALPTVRALGGGVLYLDPDGGTTSPYVRATMTKPTKLSRQSIEAITPLLLRQDYIKGVQLWSGEVVDYDLDKFRTHLTFNNLSDSHLAAFGLPLTQRDRAWLTFADPLVIPDRPIVISRSVRYHGNHGFWEAYLPAIRDRAVFVGLPKEHEIFEYTFGCAVTFFPTPDLLTLARVIAGCRQFIGNSALPHALAEAMKKDLINEYYRPSLMTMFKRAGAQYV